MILRALHPCRDFRKGEIMSLFTGPGRKSEISIIKSVKVCGSNLPTSSRCPGLSIWKIPIVFVD